MPGPLPRCNPCYSEFMKISRAHFFPPAFFAGNRQALYASLKPGSVLVLTAGVEMQHTLDQSYPFTQEPNFWYLTGIDRAGWLLIVDVDTQQEYVVAPFVAEVHQIFDGSLSATDAANISGVTQVVGKREGAQLLKELLQKKERAYTVFPQDVRYYGFHPNPAQKTLVRKLKGAKSVEDIRKMLTRQRAIKQPLEVDALQQAIDITLDGLRAIISKLPEIKSENEAEAILAYEFRRRGARHGFEPIVAAGANATTLHYADNNAALGSNDWLLLDVGASIHHYTADITRSFPLGAATDRQLSLYEALRQAQQAIIASISPDISIASYGERAEHILHEAFASVGLVPKSFSRDAIYKIMPHAISHGLGYDPHDALGMKAEDHFKPGMVLTAEIGIYLPDEQFGIRLEDDILVEDSGARNMSGALSTELTELLHG